MNILAIDTSSTSGSIALGIDGTVKYLSYLDITVTHSERLMPQIDMALKQCKIKVENIDLIALGNGPGSFTGIRIGLSTAKGLCYGLKIPLAAFNSLDILYHNVKHTSLPVATIIDARMGEIYGALYDSTGQYIVEPVNLKPDEFLDKIKKPTLFVGDGAVKYRDKIISSGSHQFGSVHNHIPLASTIISMALEAQGLTTLTYDFDKISQLEPYYLRKSQAELAKLSKTK